MSIKNLASLHSMLFHLRNLLGDIESILNEDTSEDSLRSQPDDRSDTESDFGFDLLDDEDDYDPYNDDDVFDDSGYERDAHVEWPRVESTNKPLAETPQAPWPNVAQPVAVVPTRTKPTWPNVTVKSPHVDPGKLVYSGDVVVGVVDARPHVESTGWTTVTRDSRDRTCIWADTIKGLGLGPGDQVYISRRAYGQPGVVLLKTPSQTGHLSTYLVDKHCNVRLSPSLLRKAGLGGHDNVKFKAVDNKTIVVMAG
jgi:hypothetical protein